MNNTKKSILFKIGIALFCSCCLYFFITFSNILHTQPVIIYNDNLEVKQGDKVKNTFFIKKVKYGKIITKEDYLDTSKTGKKEIKIVIENKYGKKRTYSYTITVK